MIPREGLVDDPAAGRARARAGCGCRTRLSGPSRPGNFVQDIGRARSQPHKLRYYLERRDPDFDAKMAEVVSVYRELEQLKQAAKARSEETPAQTPAVATISYDEKPGIQALATRRPTCRPSPCVIGPSHAITNGRGQARRSPSNARSRARRRAQRRRRPAIDQISQRQPAGRGVGAGRSFQHRVDGGSQIRAQHKSESGERRHRSLHRERHDQQHDRDARMGRPCQPGRDDHIEQRLGRKRAQQHAQARDVPINPHVFS